MTAPATQTASEPRQPEPRHDDVPRASRRVMPDSRAIRRLPAAVSDDDLAEAERIMGVAPIAGRLSRMRPGY